VSVLKIRRRGTPAAGVPSNDRPHLRILGTRGIPADHGGFEVFAEHLSQFLVMRGWDVTVYCQADGPEDPPGVRETVWRGVRRVHIQAPPRSLGSVVFDFRSVMHALNEPGLVYTLGYNTAIFNVFLKLRGRVNVINMDGFEWRRSKWPSWVKAWLRLNERAACLIGDVLVADNPEIGRYLEQIGVHPSRINVAAYGARAVTEADAGVVREMGLEPGRYALVVARPEPENSILEIVRAFQAAEIDAQLVVLGDLNPDDNEYHRKILASCGPKVSIPGAIFEPTKIDALRRHCRLYVHGHQVGGTNPSLVEALGAGSAVLAHDNPFNRWVAGAAGRFFADEADCRDQMRALFDADVELAAMSRAAREQHARLFRLEAVLAQHEAILLAAAKAERPSPVLGDAASRASGR